MTDLSPSPRILVVDLDDTLLSTDTLHEQCATLLFREPALLPRALQAMAGGKAVFKAFLSGIVTLDAASLPVRDSVLQLIEARREAGWHIVLCPAADHRIANAIAREIELFDEVIATDGATNLKGAEKAAVLQRRFPQGFEYAGDSRADLEIWKVAQGTILVGASPSVSRAARALKTPVVAEIPARPSGTPSVGKDWVKALRLHHGAKNLLLFVPLLLAHQWSNVPALATAIAGFILLMMVTSSTYLINDLSDLDADRKHRSKRFRPIPAGRIPIRQALPLALAAILLALACAFWLSPYYAFTLLTYLVITLSYSFGLKRVPLLDTFLIGVLFTTRLAMGMALLETPHSPWLLIFSMFFFFSLALAKRHVEIVATRTLDTGSLGARGYRAEDEALTLAFGIASGMSSLVIMVLYLAEEIFRKVFYSRPDFLWVIPVVVAVWIGRIWLLAHRGEMDDDPVTFALRDRFSIALGVAIMIAFALAM